MGNCLEIINILKDKNRTKITYTADGEWKKLLNMKEIFFAEYDVDIEDVPDSVCIIPFLCNILPIAWVFDLNICVTELDEEFYNCLDEVKQGYINMYPTIPMKGKIEVRKLIKNEYIQDGSAVLFSGGVDAFNTLINHVEESPDLLTVWGSDISLKDAKGWDIVKEANKSVAEQWRLNFGYIKTNFRTFINYKTLSKFVSKTVGGEWWHEFQHGIGLIGLAFPYAYIKKYEKIYIASSFTESMKGKYTCASDPTIDNYLKFANCKVIHDGYEFSRQDKIHNICEFYEKNKNEKDIKLRVCWESSGGKNCNECEKCWRTISGIIAEKSNPSDFGLNLTEERRKKIKKKLYKYVKYNFRYEDIQKSFLDNYSLEETPKDLLWLRDIKIESEKPKYLVIYEKITSKIKNIIKRLKRMICK